MERDEALFDAHFELKKAREEFEALTKEDVDRFVLKNKAIDELVVTPSFRKPFVNFFSW